MLASRIDKAIDLYFFWLESGLARGRNAADRRSYKVKYLSIASNVFTPQNGWARLCCCVPHAMHIAHKQRSRGVMRDGRDKATLSYRRDLKKDIFLSASSGRLEQKHSPSYLSLTDTGHGGRVPNRRSAKRRMRAATSAAARRRRRIRQQVGRLPLPNPSSRRAILLAARRRLSASLFSLQPAL